eukprot:COSAG04_NODE_6603_length_1296_cov_1.903091_1_plen_332_part_00
MGARRLRHTLRGLGAAAELAEPARPDFDSETFADYCAGGVRRLEALGARGPVEYDAQGRLAPHILEAYERTGLYIFQGLISAEEIEDLRQGVATTLERAPAVEGSALDARGRPAIGHDCAREPFQWAVPLSDPLGGTGANNGRHMAKMAEIAPPADAPDKVISLVLGHLQHSDASLRLYGHPDCLRIAASINGPDFVPFNDSVVVKLPGLGHSVAWRQPPPPPPRPFPRPDLNLNLSPPTPTHNAQCVAGVQTRMARRIGAARPSPASGWGTTTASTSSFLMIRRPPRMGSGYYQARTAPCCRQTCSRDSTTSWPWSTRPAATGCRRRSPS